MSQEINYFKLGDTVFYRGKPYFVKTLTTINECDILYQLVAVNSEERAFKNCIVQHVDKDLLSREEYLTKENELRGYKLRHENAERMWELVRNLKNVPDVEKDRLLVSIHANCLNTRNPYLDINNWGTMEFKDKSTKKWDEDWGVGGFTQPPKMIHINKLSSEARKAYLRHMNSIYGINCFESPLVKELREYIWNDIKSAKEAKKMAEERKKELSITVNEEERVVTVVFEDGSVRMSRCSKDDHFDPVIGVAMCIAARKLGSRTKLKKFVESHAKVVKPKKKAEKKDENSGK